MDKNACIKMDNSCIYFRHAYNSDMHIFLKYINIYKQYMKKWILLQMSNHMLIHTPLNAGK